jgi:hypothetical protein
MSSNCPLSRVSKFVGGYRPRYNPQPICGVIASPLSAAPTLEARDATAAAKSVFVKTITSERSCNLKTNSWNNTKLGAQGATSLFVNEQLSRRKFVQYALRGISPGPRFQPFMEISNWSEIASRRLEDPVVHGVMASGSFDRPAYCQVHTVSPSIWAPKIGGGDYKERVI